MQYRTLGKTGLQVSRLAFGCGPLAGNMTGTDFQNQLDSVQRAVDLGVNWFDTARTYGEGASETGLGACLDELGLSDQVMIGTKVRILPEQQNDIFDAVRRSVAESLTALRRDRVELVQVHNAITNVRGAQPTSLNVEDVLADRGVLAALEQLQREGVISHVGLTATGDSSAVKQVVDSGRITTLQTPFNAANISAGYDISDQLCSHQYGDVLRYGADHGIGTFAIRLFAGGALLQRQPSPYTYQTRFFPLALYQRDLKTAARLESLFPDESLAEICVRFVLSHAFVDSAIIGFGNPEHIEQAVAAMGLGDLLQEDLKQTEENALLVL